jgi:Acyl-CoA dehydrogenases
VTEPTTASSPQRPTAAPDEALLAECRAWLDENVPRETLPPIYDADGVTAHREWEKKLAAAGWGAVSWPVEFGGRDADLLTSAAVGEEFVRAGAPERLNPGGLALLGPTLLAHATVAQQRRFLPGILDCSELWCQGFSEPEAGSDLASLRTRAVRDGDELVITGVKLWTSLARYADWMFALVRTGEQGSRHRGISYVLIDVHQPGVEITPLRQVTGADSFSEVRFDGARVPLDQVVGEIDGGWSVAMSTLGRERGSALHTPAHLERELGQLAHLAISSGASADAAVRVALGELESDVRAYRALVASSLRDAALGLPPARGAALGKLWWSELAVRMADLGRELAVDAGDADAEKLWQYRYWHSRAGRLLAGTSEIQREIVAERVLGLPKGSRHG